MQQNLKFKNKSETSLNIKIANNKTPNNAVSKWKSSASLQPNSLCLQAISPVSVSKQSLQSLSPANQLSLQDISPAKQWSLQVVSPISFCEKVCNEINVIPLCYVCLFHLVRVLKGVGPTHHTFHVLIFQVFNVFFLNFKVSTIGDGQLFLKCPPFLETFWGRTPKARNVSTFGEWRDTSPCNPPLHQLRVSTSTVLQTSLTFPD